MSIKSTIIRLRNYLFMGSYSRSDFVKFSFRGKMFVDPAEPRGKKLLNCGGVSRFRNSWFWRSSVRRLEPDLALDIGANYGEMALCSSYNSGCQIILIEANSNLVSLLNKSVASRDDGGEAWKVVHAAVSDVEGEAEFQINKKSSGESRLKVGDGIVDNNEIERVNLIPVSSILEAKDKKRVLFKVDVEGAEINALMGMRTVLDRSQSFIGIVELSEVNLQYFGRSTAELWDLAKSMGRVALFNDLDQIVDCSHMSYAEALQEQSKKGLRVNKGADLIIYKSVDDIESLAPPRLLNQIRRLIGLERKIYE